MKSPIRCVLIAMAIATACSVWTPNPALAQGPSSEVTVGIPWQGEPGITESVADIMVREAQVQAMGLRAGHGPQKPVQTHTRLLSHRENLPQNPDALTIEPTGPAQASLTSTLAPQTVGTSFVGATLADSFYLRPDSMGAAGFTQILVCVNGRIRTFNKAGVQDGALDANTDTFFASVRNNAGTFDPRVVFDRLSQRWFVVMINVSTPNRVLIAVSSGPTITSTSSFNFFQFQHDLVGPTPNPDTGGLADYPSLGVDANALYIGVNIFGTAFLGSTGFVIQKSVLLGGSLTVTAFRHLAASTGPGPFSPRGVTNDDPSATEGYFVGTDNASFGLLVLRRISNPGGVPAISGNLNLTIPATSFPSNVPARGSHSPLDALDDRLYSALLKNSSLWTAHNIRVDSTGNASSTGDRDAMRWYEITSLTSTPTLNQSGTLFDSSPSNPKYYWVGSVATSGQGHMALGASYAGVADFAGVALTGRLATDPLGTLGVPTFIPRSTSYNVETGYAQRWGGYSFTTVDPTDDMTMWTFQEICNATNSWGVLVTKLLAPPPATPSAASPASANQGTTLNIVITGTSTSGSGFFDGGSGFPNHIAATVNGGGVTVNGVTFTNPTGITLNLTVANNAALGARTITATNPDGQSATSASGILTVVASTTTTVASNPNPSIFGQGVQLTATVSSGSGTPTGPVAFFDGATNIGSDALNGSGQATLSTAMLAVGPHSITASYGGDANFNGSTSSALTQTVKQASTTTVVTSSANPSVSGQSVAFTARVAAVGPGAGTPSGSVTFKDGGAVLGTGTLSAGSTSFTTSSLSIGSHSIKAIYGGDASFGGSTSATLNQKIIGASLTPASATFAPQNDGTPSTPTQQRTFTLTNLTSSTMNISTAAFSGLNASDFSVTGGTCPPLPHMLAAGPGTSCTFIVSMTPSVNGLERATFSVTDDAGTQSAPVKGTGIGASISPTTATYAAQNDGTISAGKTFTFNNYGTAPLTITYGFTGANPADFPTDASSTCPVSGGSVAGSSNCTFVIKFAPTANGPESATFTVSDVDGNQTVTLKGTGIAASLTPRSVTFANTTVGMTSAIKTFTFHNYGSTSLAFTAGFTGTDAGDFPIQPSSTCLGFAGTLPAGTSCTYDLRFAPTGPPPRAESATFGITDAYGTQSATLSGKGL